MMFTLLALAISTALAAPSTPCTAYSGMTDADRDGFCAFVGASTATSTGWSGKTDCRDDIATINPGVAEEVADGIDQDCSGSDAVYPVTDAVAKRYLANSGTAGPVQFIAEYGVCSAAAECDVDDVAGIFKITAAAQETHAFKDIYVNGSKVLRNSGQKADGREVVTIDEAQHFRGSTGSGGGSGVGKTYIDGSVKVLREERDKLREEVLAADAALDSRLDTIETGNTGRDEELNRLGDVDTALEGLIADNEDAIAAEVIRAKAAEAGILVIARGASDDAGLASRKASAAASHGPLIEAGAVAGGLFHRPLITDSGDEIRGSAIGGGGFELRAGVDSNGWQTAGFGQFSFGSDGLGTGPDTGLLIGADVLFDVKSVEIGPWLAYLRTEDHANLLDVNVVETGGLVGATLQGNVVQDSAFRAIPFVRAGVGFGYYGTRGSSENGPTVVSNYDGLFVAQAGVRIGAGALQD